MEAVLVVRRGKWGDGWYSNIKDDLGMILHFLTLPYYTTLWYKPYYTAELHTKTYSTVILWTVLYYAILCHTMLELTTGVEHSSRGKIENNNILNYVMPHGTALHCNTIYHATLCYTAALQYTTLHHTITYYTILVRYYVIPYYAILYRTILSYRSILLLL